VELEWTGKELRGATLIIRHLAVMQPEVINGVVGRTRLKKKHPPSLYIVIAWCIKQCKSIDYHCVTMFSSIIGQQSWFDFGFTRSPE
jgi:hypothetical protein